ncbi:MAG: polyisoprenoid-binding protein [Candidatus Fervidibacterota bacterium]
MLAGRRALLLLGLAMMLSRGAVAQTYSVDGVHSFVWFRCKNLAQAGSWVIGRFNEISGTIVVAKELAKSSVEITINAASLDTGVPDRDNHLKSPDFLNVKQFPTITFKSTRIRQLKPNLYEVTGDLTLHGTTKPITVRVRKIAEGRNFKGAQVVAFEGSFTIKRSEFGMRGLFNLAGDEVSIYFSVQGIRR